MSDKSMSERALVARVNRKLARELESNRVRVCREDSRWFGELGRHFMIDVNTNVVVGKHLDLNNFLCESEAP